MRLGNGTSIGTDHNRGRLGCGQNQIYINDTGTSNRINLFGPSGRNHIDGIGTNIHIRHNHGVVVV
jgi:hypothetical protein